MAEKVVDGVIVREINLDAASDHLEEIFPTLPWKEYSLKLAHFFFLISPAYIGLVSIEANDAPEVSILLTATFGAWIMVIEKFFIEDGFDFAALEENKTLKALLDIFPTIGEKPHRPPDFPWNQKSSD